MPEPPDRDDGSRLLRGSTRRRQFLQGLVASGVGGVAGCVGEFGSTGDAGVWNTTLRGDVNELDLVNPGGRLGSVAFDVGAAIDPATREYAYVLAEEIEETPTTISVTLKPDLEWSNGEPLTAAAFGRWLHMYRTGSSRFVRVPAVRDGSRQPRTGLEAITDVEWDDRTLTVEGAFDVAPSPLFDINTLLGSRPPTYYGWLWERFQDAFDDVPWEDEQTRSTVTELIDDNIWGIAAENRPEEGVHLEDSYDGEGWEAAFSGLWYPFRIGVSELHFRRNDAHPFADRVSHDRLVWTYRPGEQNVVGDLNSGAVDGWMGSDVTTSLVDSFADELDSFEGPASNVSSLTLNHSTRRFGERDVRAALLYAIDRTALRDNLGLVTRRPVTVPGGDLQPDWLLPPELGEELRAYDYDPDRAAALLEGAGFERDDGAWFTPDGDRFDVELLVTHSDPVFGEVVSDQLRGFGVDASAETIEETTYEARRSSGSFVAAPSTWSSPAAAGRPRTRGDEYVRAITQSGPADSAYLRDAVDAAIEDESELRWRERTTQFDEFRFLEYDAVSALRSITVEAPPLGEPDGALEEWPYLYHAAMADRTQGETQLEHARICTWLYNYQLPELELLVTVPLVVHDTQSWSVPDPSDPVWNYVGTGNYPTGVWAALAWGHVDRQ